MLLERLVYEVLLLGFRNTGADATSEIFKLKLQPSIGANPSGTSPTTPMGQSESSHFEFYLCWLAKRPRFTQSSTSSGGAAFEPQRVFLCGLEWKGFWQEGPMWSVLTTQRRCDWTCARAAKKTSFLRQPCQQLARDIQTWLRLSEFGDTIGQRLSHNHFGARPVWKMWR